MKIAPIFLAFDLILALMPYSSLSGATYEKYSCDNGYFLDRSVSDHGVQTVHWSHEIDLHSQQKVRAGGGYMKGHKIRLGDLALWLDREIPEKGIWVYQDIGNSVTQSTILAFNEHTNKMAIISINTMKSDVYQCQLAHGN